MQVIPTTSGFIPNGQGAHAMNSGFLPNGQGAPAFIGQAQPPGMAPSAAPVPMAPGAPLAALEAEAANLFARMRAAVAAAAAAQAPAPAPAPAAQTARGDVDRWLAALEARLTVLERWAFSRVPVPPPPPANAHDHGPTPAELDAPAAPTAGA